MLDVSPDPPGCAREDDKADDEIEAMKPRLEHRVCVPLCAEQLPDVSQAQAPGERAEERVEDEARHVHARDAGREGDKGAHHRQQSAGKDYDLAVTRKPTISQI